MVRPTASHQDLFAFSVPLLVLLALTLWLVQLAGTQQVERILTAHLLGTGRIVQRFIAKERERLRATSVELARDFALKPAIATYDPATLTSVAVNYRDRIGVDLLWITDESGKLLGDSSGRRAAAEPQDLAPIQELYADADAGLAVIELDGELLQMVVVPVLAPDVIGYLVLGSIIGDATAEQLKSDSGSHVTFLTSERVFASSWPQAQRSTLFPNGRAGPSLFEAANGNAFLAERRGERFLSIRTALPSRLPLPLFVLVQDSYDEALAPVRALRHRIALIGLGSVLLTVLLSTLLAKSITAPIGALAAAMGDVLNGNFARRIHLRRRDEIGYLASSFNEMVIGLARGEWIKDTFGRFVSREVADAVLEGRVSLEGERREVTILFQDLRGFTSLSERTDPADLVALLNQFFTEVVAAVEEQGGVVRQFTGDGVMALFGAPQRYEDSAERAVRAAIGMVRRISLLNQRLEQNGKPPLRVGIGVHTGSVIAGQIGPDKRVEYGVVGDPVNVASRIEGLTKELNATILVSSETAERLGPEFTLGRSAVMAVRGKEKPVQVIEVLSAG